MLSRRHFAQQLGASAFLLPFLSPRRVQAAPVAPRNLVVIWNMATNINFWRPTSAPGQPIAFGDSCKPLAEIADKVVLVDGLSPGSTDETHGTPQALTGRGFSGGTFISVDQFIATKLGLPAPLLLGVRSATASGFMNSARSAANAGGLAPNDDPRNAYAQLFGTNTPAPAAGGATGSTLPRRALLDLSAKQIRSLQATLGSEQKTKLEVHLDAIAALEKSLAGAPTLAKGCTKPTLASDGLGNPEDQAATLTVGEAHRELIVGALGCGLTQVIGMQWGTTTVQFLGGSFGYDEHGAIHTSGNDQGVIKAEQYFHGWFVGLINKLAATADPRAAGKSLLDTTLLVWTRDFGTQDPSVHANYSMPFVLAGASDYLATTAGGRYLNFGADNRTATKGVRHERLLLNICEAMGVKDYSGFGALSGSDQQPLPNLRR